MLNEIKAVNKIADHFYDINIAKLDGDFEFPELSNTKLPEETRSDREIILNAGLQFCFFLGDSKYKPFASYEMTKLVHDGIKMDLDLREHERHLINLIETSGVTMIPERVEAVHSMIESLEYYGDWAYGPEKMFSVLMTIPTFRKDPFLKKTFLAMQHFNLPEIPAPMDYQIPKVLEALGCIKYDCGIKHKIQTSYVFRENTKEELGIRSAALKAVQKLAEVNNVTPTEVDQWLFNKKINSPELTISAIRRITRHLELCNKESSMTK